MALILFVYARTSIRAAKANAQRHREMDTGGEGLSLLNEHRRRHGLGGAKKVEEGGTVSQLGKQLIGGSKNEVEKEEGAEVGRSEDEERLRAMKGRRGGGGN